MGFQLVGFKKCHDSHHCHKARPGSVDRCPGIGQHEGNEVDGCCGYVDAFPWFALVLDGHEAAEEEKGHFPRTGDIVMAVQLEFVAYHPDGSAGGGVEIVSGKDGDKNDCYPCCPDQQEGVEKDFS